jgi:hypothetical protein
MMLLAVFAAAPAVADVIVEQSYDGSSEARISQELPDYPDFSAYQLDDFTTTQDWLVGTLTAPGEDIGNPFTNIDVLGEIWTDLPEDPNCATSGELVMSGQGTEDPDTATLTIDFNDQLLPAGDYWLRVYVVREFGDHGFWKWYSTTPVNGSEAYYYNPSGAHGYGPCPIPGSERYGEVRDMAFTLEGTPGTECVGDVDGDGDTDHSDLGMLLGDWGCYDPENGCVGDLDGDDDTDHADLGIFLADWGCGT